VITAPLTATTCTRCSRTERNLEVARDQHLGIIAIRTRIPNPGMAKFETIPQYLCHPCRMACRGRFKRVRST